MKTAGLIIFLIGALMVIGPIVQEIQFNIGCGGYLKSAADAPTIELAKIELDTAISYMESENLTSGHSHLIIRNRQADVGYWYTRVKEARLEMDKITSESTDQESNIMLMKLRETLLDEGDSGTVVTTPPHIALFPLQWLLGIVFFLGVLFVLGGAFVFFVGCCE